MNTSIAKPKVMRAGGEAKAPQEPRIKETIDIRSVDIEWEWLHSEHGYWTATDSTNSSFIWLASQLVY